MKLNKKKQKLYATTVTLALAAGVTAGVTGYRSSTQFQPSASSREIRENRVSFSQEGKRKEQSQDESQDNSALWEKDEQAQEQSKLDAARDAAYLFEQSQNQLNNGSGQTSMNIAQNNENQIPDVSGQKKQSDQNEKDPVYDITDKKENADTVIRNNSNGTSDKKNNGQGGGKADTSGKDSDKTPGKNDGDTSNGNGSSDRDDSHPGENRDDNHGSQDSDKNDHGGNTGKNDKDDKDDSGNGSNKPSKPTIPAATAKDPAIVKKPDASIGWGESQKDYNEKDVTTKITHRDVRILQGSDEAALYKGQTVDGMRLFFALDTYVYDLDTYTAYTWNQSDYERYIRIASVSFDGGENWITQFPVTIPENLEEGMMYIKVEWRYSEKDKWEEYITPYYPYATRLFLLPKRLEKENEEIDADTLLNQWDQFPSLGILKLYNYTGKFFTNDGEQLTALLPGWTENGEPVPWSYELTSGRHILEPQDLVPLDPMYKVEIQFGWFGADDRIALDIMAPDTKLYYLQTLTGLNLDAAGENESKYVKKLTVPKYIQSIAMAEAVETDVISIPDTVLYIENNGKNLRVNKAYQVDAGNPNYTSEDGLLMNKEKTEMIGIPYEKEEVTVGKTITKVNLTTDNQLKMLQIKADNIGEFPEISLENLHNCKVIAEDQILDEFLEQYGEELTENQNCVASSSDPNRVYTMKNGMAVDQDGVLYRILGYKGNSLRLSSDITAIGPEAFCKTEQLRVLIWPKDCQIELSPDSFAGSSVEKIICQSQEQMETLTTYLKQLGIKDIELIINEKSDEGYIYYSESVNGKITTTLTEAPKEEKEFYGIIKKDGKEIAVNEIAANAFSNCDQLEWVILPEETCYIGYQAFRNCSSLQGMLINARDTVTIGNQAFQGCDALRFVASNAQNGVMEDGYDPDITNQEYYEPDRKFHYFFVPYTAEGYGANANRLSEAYGVDHYEICQTGAQGKVLYGVDEKGGGWLALRSGSILDEETSLPKGTTQIYSYAFSGSRGTGDGYRINWEEIPLMEVQEGAFYESEIAGHVRFGTEQKKGFVSLRQNAFAFCKKIQSVTVKDHLHYLGQEMFLGDAELKEAEFADAADNVSFYTGIFNGCNQLEKLILGMQTPLQLVAYAPMKYQFNYDWTPEEEAEHLQLIIPEESKMEYLMSWRYRFAGSFSFYFAASYLDLRLTVRDDIMFDFYPDDPPEDEIDRQTKQKLLEGENRLRKMTGMPEVSEPTELYQYRQEGVNLTLVGIPSYVTDLTLDGATMDFPEGWYLDAIGKDAFSGAANLSKITICDNLSEIASGALNGAAQNSDSVLLNIVKAEDNNTIATLSDYTEGTPFTFGADESKIHIQVPNGEENDYIRSWVYPLTGYADEKEMEAVIREQAANTEKNGSSTDAYFIDTENEMDERDAQELLDQKVQDEMVALLLPAENRLRHMMGMKTIEDPRNLICYDYIVYDDAKEIAETEDSEAVTEDQTESGTSDQESEPLQDQPCDTETSDTDSAETEETTTPETEETEQTSESEETEQTSESEEQTETKAGEAETQTETEEKKEITESERE